MRVILLDLDDTLFDRGAAFRRWCDRHARGAELAAADDRGRRSRVEFARDAVAHTGGTVAALAARFPTELAACVEPEPGVRDLVAALAARTRVAIVTNGSSVAQRAKLARTGLADVVHAVFVSAEVGQAKPAAAIFERAIAWSGRPARDHLFVGDDPVNDIAPAAALGMATAWRAREAWPATLPLPDHTLASLAGLAELAA